jgi:hypothetical protein
MYVILAEKPLREESFLKLALCWQQKDVSNMSA